jgi:hypothetical protein
MNSSRKLRRIRAIRSSFSSGIEASTQDSKEQTEFDNILAVTVKSNDGQIAEFTDGSTIVRNMPDFEAAPSVNHKKIIQPDHFRHYFYTCNWI